MSNIKGWFQGLKQKNKDDEGNGEENTTSTVGTAEEQVTLSNSNQENNMNEDLPESDQNTISEKNVAEELNLDDHLLYYRSACKLQRMFLVLAISF